MVKYIRFTTAHDG
ncbi:hypothetical protein D047_1205A, partial [Vibrio parahaemolyticus VPTS-2010_2]